MLDAQPFVLPLAVPFRGLTHREGLLIEGPSGWGEFAPFVEYDDATAAVWLAGALEAAFGTWPTPLREAIPVNAIVPAVSPELASDLVRQAVDRDGCSTIKVKVAQVGQTLDDDVARVGAVAACLRDAGVAQPRIRVDANAAWSVEQARVAIGELDLIANGLEFVEQPCASLSELAQIRRLVHVPIAADESIRRADDPIKAAQAGAADIVVLKALPLGGVVRALEIAQVAGLDVVVSGSMDTAVGLASGLALAAALPDLPYACGLGTGALLAADVVATPLTPKSGELVVERLAPDPAFLQEAGSRMAPERRDWWHARLQRALALLGPDSPGMMVR